MAAVIQKLKRKNKDEYEVGERYYGLLSSLNSLKLTQREIQLVTFMAINKTISYPEMKRLFCEKHSTSEQTISNMISRLKKTKVIIKERGRLKVHPQIAISFTEGVVLQITLTNGI